MGKDAYELQGRNGLDRVTDGQAFVGRSAGLLVTNTATFEFVALAIDGVTPVTFSSVERPIGFFPGGTVTEVTVTTGEVAVYPLDANYTIV